MAGSTKGGYASGRSDDKIQKLRLLSENNLRRLKNLTLGKVYVHLADYIYKEATLLVVHKKFETPPLLESSKLQVECKLLNANYKKQITKLSNLAAERIDEFFQDGAKCLGVFYNDQLIAYSWCHYKDHYFPFFNYSIEVTDGVYIGPDFVAPEFRGNKIHGYLLTRMFALLYEEGCEYVLGSVLHNNHASIKGLKSVGFTPKKQVAVSRVLKSMVYKKMKELSQW